LEDGETDLLRRILYGTDEPCPECYGRASERRGAGYYPTRPTCLPCHGTGRIKTPGLVERVMLDVIAAAGIDADPLGPDDARDVRVGDVREPLRREIGEKP
jgi:hypothetical protein